MSNWIFIATDQETPTGTMSASDIYTRLMKEGDWGLGERTPNRGKIQEGDRVVFYLGRPQIQFVGTAKIKGKVFRRTPEQRDHIGHLLNLPGAADHGVKDAAEYGVKLDHIETWAVPKDARSLVPALDFIENKVSWGAYFQGGVRQLSDKDFFTISSPRDLPLTQQMKSEPDLSNESEFALEAHLEEFIAENWASINFRQKLKLYSADGVDGRQFPAGEWSIDFLCVDEKTGDFVVIELKRGKTSDAVVGQIARYMVWVRENLATKGQKVRGIVIAREADAALKMAVKIIPDISIKTYTVKFDLRDEG